MPNDYLPSREGELVLWSLGFSAQINLTPGAFGLLPVMAAQYQALHDDYAAKYQAANESVTRTPTAITAKNDARRALEADARRLAGIIQAAPGVSDDQKRGLGLTVRKLTKTRVARPDTWPRVSVVSTFGHRVRLRLSDFGPTLSRGKPAGVAGAAVFSFVGHLPPADDSLWKYEGNATRLFFEVKMPMTARSGASIWFRAAWFNRRGERGPASQAIYTNLGFGMGLAMAA